MTIQEFAQLYIDHGWDVVPLDKKAKKVSATGWMSIDFTAKDFREGDNIGLKSIGNGLVFADLDSPECVAFGNAFLPDTPSIYGRPSKPRSKRIYKSIIPTGKTIAHKDSDNTMLIELRTNHQDMAPPSVHPSGEVLVWESDLGTPAEVEGAVLVRCITLCATAALIARHYAPSGTRHEWTLALAGTLKRRGVSEEEMILLVQEAGQWSRDAKLNDRIREVSSTYAHSDEDPTTGATKLKELATGKLAESLIDLWGAAPSSSSAYAVNSKGFPDARSISNITLALTRLGTELTYDIFARKPFMTYNNVSALLDDDNATDLWLDVDQKELFRPTKELFFDVLKSVARQSSFHPVLDYFATLSWDGKARLDTWLTTSANAANTPYTRAVSALVLIAAVRRVRDPGCKFDEMLVLESPQQGLLKSTAIRTLCHDPKWFSDDLPLNADSKNLIERTSGKWIIEASDLSGMRASDHEALKSMLSRQVDGPVRLAYARLPIEQPRQFIIIGTTNSSQYLSDQTGNRRFWPIAVEEFDIAWIRENRDQIWAEACAREANGEEIRLDPSLWQVASSQQSQRVFAHPWIEALANEYSDREPGVRLTREEIWEFLGVPTANQNTPGNKTVSAGMQALGYKRITIRTPHGPKENVAGWGRD